MTVLSGENREQRERLATAARDGRDAALQRPASRSYRQRRRECERACHAAARADRRYRRLQAQDGTSGAARPPRATAMPAAGNQPFAQHETGRRRRLQIGVARTRHSAPQRARSLRPAAFVRYAPAARRSYPGAASRARRERSRVACSWARRKERGTTLPKARRDRYRLKASAFLFARAARRSRSRSLLCAHTACARRRCRATTGA